MSSGNTPGGSGPRLTLPHGDPVAVELTAVIHSGDPDDDTGGDRPETPLHWAASTDDVDVAVALIDGGADLETQGGSIGTPLDNAIDYGCRRVARLLVARGAKVDKLWHAAALGMLERTAQLLLTLAPHEPDAVSQAFWHACAGGQRRAAEYLLAHGAELNWVPEYNSGTPLDAAKFHSTGRENVIAWLQERGAVSGTLSEWRVAEVLLPAHV